MRRVLAIALVLVACGAGPTGDLSLYVEGEDTITRGLEAGTSEDTIVDGWSVAYHQFVVTLGAVRVARTSTGAERTSPALHTFDLHALSARGFALADLSGLEASRWDVIEFRTPGTTVSATRDASVSESDFAEMVAGECTYLIAGVLTEEATGRVVDFRLCVPADTSYGPCSTPDGMSGVAVASAATTPAHVTLHGDHLWFDTFPSGAESTVSRRARWMVDCDHDGDGHVTEAELRATPAAAVFTTTRGYSLAGAPTVDGHGIVTAWDFVRAQMSTLGHFQGEGECPWSPTPSGI